MGGPPRRTSCLVAESPGFTGLRAPSLPGFPISPLPGQCINSQPWLRALSHRVPPLMRARPGCRRCRTRATGLSPVGPLVGWRGGCLAVGPVRGAMRHYCLGGCSALVMCVWRSWPVRGGWGRCWVLCLPCFPLPAPRFLRCVWRVVPSGCPLSSLAGTPFHAVCAFRGLGPVALLVFPACPLCVCARALAASAPPPSPGWCGARTSRGPGARHW